MCLAIPSEIVELKEDNTAVVDTMGTRRVISLHLLPEPACLGDYVLVHVGYAIQKIDRANAVDGLDLIREAIGALENNENNNRPLADK